MKYKVLTHFIVAACLLSGAFLMAYVNVERNKTMYTEQSNDPSNQNQLKCNKDKKMH